MLSEKAKSALDVRDNVRLAREFIGSMSYESFKASRLHFYAVTRALEIVSEAARRLPDSVRERQSLLPWKKIMGVGNVYRHSYDNVIESFVRSTVHDHLEPLLNLVTAEIEAFEGEP